MKQIKTLTVNGISYEIADPDAASIDDTKVGPDAWSAKHIIDRLCPAFTQTAPAVTCRPVAGYPLSVVSRIEAATDTLRLWQGGKSLFDLPQLLGDASYSNTVNGVTAELKDGMVHLHGTNTLDDYSGPLFSARFSKDRYPVPPGTYSTPSRMSVQLCDKDTGMNKNYSGTFTITKTMGLVYFYVAVRGNETVDMTFPLMLVAGSQIPVEYEPYRGKTLEMPLGKTVQGGSYDWAAGILTDEAGETTQYTPMEMTALPGVNTLLDYQGAVTVSGRQDLPALLETLTS